MLATLRPYVCPWGRGQAAGILEGRRLSQGEAEWAGEVALRPGQDLPENWPKTLKDMKCDLL